MTHFRKSIHTVVLLFSLCIALPSADLQAKPADHVPGEMLRSGFTLAVPGSRPDRNFHYLSPNGHFMIHYDTSGYHAVAADYHYHPSVPDYVFCAAQYLEDSYDMLRDSLGFDPPPADDAGQPEIDVYFFKYSNMYGETYPEQNLGDEVWTSYIRINSDLEDSTLFYTTGLEGLKVTCAHELFHVFQLGYRFRNRDYFYFEMSSVWFEEYMYPEVNDYHSYVEEYSLNWNYALDNSNLYYNNAGFNLTMDARYSTGEDNVIRAVWEQILTEPALDAIATVLEERGGSMENALCDWGAAQVLCATYSAANFPYPFDDAAELPSISFSRYPGNVISGSEVVIRVPAAPMTGYYKFSGQPARSLLLNFSFPEHMQVKLIALNGGQSRVYPMKHSPLLIDGAEFPEWVLSVAATDHSDSGTVEITVLNSDQITGIFPNPLSSPFGTTLHYTLTDTRERGTFSLYDIRGRRLYRSELPAELLTVGPHEYPLVHSTSPLPSGIYIVVLELDGRWLTSKLTILK
jgi:hypothetical protein